MVKQSLTAALVKSILQVLDQVDPTELRRHRRRPRRRDRRGSRHRRPVLRGTLDMDWLHRIGGDPGVGPSHQALEPIPNPRVRVTQRPPSPSPAPLAYWPMESSDPATSLRGHREPPCVIHGMGSCPYPVALWRSVLSSSSPREGEREGEEGVTDVEDVVEVTVIEEEDDDEPVKVIPVLESPPRRSMYKQTTRIRIGPRGRPTGPLAPRTGAREAGWDSPETGSVVWLPPPPPPTSGAVTIAPPPPLSGASTTAPPPQDTATANESPSLWSPIGGRILRCFTQLVKPSRPGHRPGAWDLPHQP
jgi:hypothetical protein